MFEIYIYIKHWATIFKNDQDFKPIESFYAELRTKGVDFPVYDPESATFESASSEKKEDIAAASSHMPQPQAATHPRPHQSNLNINTASANNAPLASPTRHTLPRSSNVNPQFQRLADPPLSGTVIKLNDEQMVKLNSELDIVDSNVQVLNEILTEVNNSVASGHLNLKSINQNDKDIVLLKELYQTCKEMQKRITQLIGNISNENIISKLWSK